MKRIAYLMSAIISSLLFAFSGWPSLPTTVAETNPETTAIYQSLLDLNYPFTIMCIAAHPDDEDSETLAYYRMKYGARTVIVTCTRGEGGQNSIGPELYEELGVVRTRELAAAASKLDALTFNLALPEFGFSKSSQETFARWDHKEALRRMVYAIRLFQPDIIITQHDPKTGHGHHQAARILAEEAFEAAADRYRYTEQISAHMEPWQAKRLFARTLSKERYDTEFDVHELSPILNKQYSRIAYQSRLEHKTQGPWPEPNFNGERLVRYNLIKNLAGEFRRWYLFDQNLPVPEIYSKVDNLIFDQSAPSPAAAASLPRAELINRIIAALNLTRAYLKSPEGQNDLPARTLNGKLEKSLLLLTGIAVKVTTNAAKTAPGLDLTAKATLNNASALPLEVTNLNLSLPDEWEQKETSKIGSTVEAGGSASSEFAITLSAQAAPTLPLPAHLYDANFLEPQINAIAQIKLKDLNEPLLVIGAARVEVSAAVEMEINPNNIAVNVADLGDTNTYSIPVKITNNLRTPLAGRLNVAQAQVVRANPEDQQFTIPPSATGAVSFFVTIGRPVPEGTANLPVTLSDNTGREIVTSSLKLHLVKVRVSPQIKVGYLRSFDYTLPETLKFLAVRSSELSLGEIGNGNLISRYDTIVLDNRAYLAYPELVKVNNKLLDFVRDGGTLIVLYQRPGDWNNNTLSPYPIKLGDDRITDETAPVTILQPEHALMSRPNKISSEDFNNWIQERGLSFPSSWDERYHTLLASADPGEDELKGGLLVTEYGRGQYVYTSYVVYRQLRAFNPGAYHIFANMLSLPRTR